MVRGITGTEIITVTRKVDTGLKDKYGNPVTSLVSFDVTGVLAAPGNHSITVDMTGWESNETITFYLPINTVIFSSDDIEYNGLMYHPTGTPIKWVTQKGSPVKPKLVVVAQLTSIGEL